MVKRIDKDLATVTLGIPRRSGSFWKGPLMFDLTGKTALVTQAPPVAIGGAIAKALHGQGAKVVLSGTAPKRWKR